MTYIRMGQHNTFLRSWYQAQQYETTLAYANTRRRAKECRCGDDQPTNTHDESCPLSAPQAKSA